MPFYEYLCTACGRHTEMLQKVSDPVATECPACHAEALVKQVSAAGFRLKGGGWYETDFKSSGQRNLVNDAGGDGASASDSTASTSSGGHGCAAGACGCAAPAASSTTSNTAPASTASTASSSASGASSAGGSTSST